jgi:hypothetical protein
MHATVYLLQHVRECSDGHDDVKVIGVYSTTKAASAAIERLSTKPGFREFPEGFSIDSYEMDRDHWVDGFG